MQTRSSTIWFALAATSLGVLLLMMSGCAGAEGITERASVPPAAAPAVVIVTTESVLERATMSKPVLPPAEEATPPLDIKSLEARLKETNAIGAFTKLKLKTQVDDLLGQLRAYYQGRLQASLTDLRRTYDQLVFRVLALLRDADPQLATAVASSREPIWGVLSDPAKFASM